jgi:hypothetical protein
VEKNVRPERPNQDEAPKLCDDIWELALKCWRKEPPRRPTADSVCETISHLLETRNTVGVQAPLIADGNPDAALVSSTTLPAIADACQAVKASAPLDIKILPQQSIIIRSTLESVQKVGDPPIMVQPTSRGDTDVTIALPQRRNKITASNHSDSNQLPTMSGAVTGAKLYHGRRSKRDHDIIRVPSASRTRSRSDSLNRPQPIIVRSPRLRNRSRSSSRSPPIILPTARSRGRSRSPQRDPPKNFPAQRESRSSRFPPRNPPIILPAPQVRGRSRPPRQRSPIILPALQERGRSRSPRLRSPTVASTAMERTAWWIRQQALHLHRQYSPEAPPSDQGELDTDAQSITDSESTDSVPPRMLLKYHDGRRDIPISHWHYDNKIMLLS